MAERMVFIGFRFYMAFIILGLCGVLFLVLCGIY
jgi:hypothetical protein